MKRILTLTALATVLALPAMAEEAGISVGANTNVGVSSSADVNSSASRTSDMTNPGATMDDTSSPGVSKKPSTDSNASVNGSANSQQTIQAEALDNNEVKLIQQALRQEGFYNGTADGVWGPRTASALMQFQQRNQLGATGSLNTQTLDKLGVDIDADASATSSTSSSTGSSSSGKY